MSSRRDVIVVGGGNAALCAALSAREHCQARAGARARAGGRGRRQLALHRRADARRLQRRRGPEEADSRSLRARRSHNTDFGTYTEDQFFDDMGRVTRVPLRPGPHRDPGEGKLARDAAVDARQGRALHRRSGAGRRSRSAASSSSGAGSRSRRSGGGPGLVECADPDRAKERHRDLVRRARDLELIADDAGVHGVRVEARRQDGRSAGPTPWCSPAAASRPTRSGARATSGRAGSSPRCAARASTPATRSAWRSTSAPRAVGNWSGCHAVGWDRNAPEFGDLAVGDGFQKHSYPWGITQRRGQALRRRGRGLPQLHLRQVRPRDPAAAGAVRLADLRPQGAAPVARRVPHPAGDARERRTRSRSWSAKLDDIDRDGRARRRSSAYNAAVQTDMPFNPNVKDGRGTEGLAVNKSNWANTLDDAARSRPTRSPAASPSASAA